MPCMQQTTSHFNNYGSPDSDVDDTFRRKKTIASKLPMKTIMKKTKCDNLENRESKNYVVFVLLHVVLLIYVMSLVISLFLKF